MTARIGVGKTGLRLDPADPANMPPQGGIFLLMI
jgi:hypothetical protein